MRKLALATLAILMISATGWLYRVDAASESDRLTISDIEHWNHPVKPVLARYRVRLFQLDLLQGRTYPVFYVGFPRDLNQDTVSFYSEMLDQVAKANGYWDFRMVDAGRHLTVEVSCNRKERNVAGVAVNGDPEKFRVLRDADLAESFDKAVRVLEEKVPEIEAYHKQILDYSRRTGEKVTMIYRYDHAPDPRNTDPYLRDYYHIYVGESHPEHTVRWHTFLVRKDYGAILVDDPVGGCFIELDKWRNNK